MLFSVKIQLFVFFCVILATFLPLNVVSSTSAQKVKRASLPSVVMRIYERIDHLTARVDQLESNGNNTFDVQEMMTRITRAISDSNGQIVKQFEEKLKKTIEKIEQNNLKKMENFEKNVKKIDENILKIMEKIDENNLEIMEKIDENNLKIMEKIDEKLNKIEKLEQKLAKMESILLNLLNGSDAVRSDEVWSGVTSQCESMCRAKLTTWANHTGSQLRTIVQQMELCDSSEPKAVVNTCDPNPCLHGGKCLPSSTGNDYACVCLKFTNGSRCQNVECTVAKKCWRLNDTVYTVTETPLRWTEAKVKCENEHMTLAMPKDQERTQFLHDQLKPIYSAQYNLWLGLKRDENGKWFWVDGSALGEYTGGQKHMKNEPGAVVNALYFHGGSNMWWWGHGHNQYYAVCEANLISH